MSLHDSHSPVKVLIADDSSFMRAALSRMVESDDSLCVIGTAENGLDAIAKIGALHPDVVTLDIDMPGLDGLETLKRVMTESPLPVIIVSSVSRRGGAATIEALELGAFDCVAKGLSYDSADVIKIQNELVGKIKAAAGPRVPARRPSIHPVRQPLLKLSEPTVKTVVPTIIAIGTSTGGPKALEETLTKLPADLPAAILIVQHMPAGLIEHLTKRLNEICPLDVRGAKDGETVTAGRVYLAPAGRHLIVRRRTASETLLRLSLLPNNIPHIPSVDVMMTSVAEAYGAAAMGIILTGMGNDGALGMQAIFREGGQTLGQDPNTCMAYGMPRSCVEMGVLNDVLSLQEIPSRILSALDYRKPH
jgi:two-component system chemotaxis response regulator CheB